MALFFALDFGNVVIVIVIVGIIPPKSSAPSSLSCHRHFRRHVVMSSCHRPPSPPSPLPGGGPWRQRHHRDFGLLVCCAEASSISRPISRQPVTPPLLPGVSASALFLQPPPAPTQPGSPFSLRPATSSRVPQCSRRPRGPPPTPGPKCAILAGPLTMQPPTPALPPKAAVSGLRFHAILLSGLAGQAGR